MERHIYELPFTAQPSNSGHYDGYGPVDAAADAVAAVVAGAESETGTGGSASPLDSTDAMSNTTASSNFTYAIFNESVWIFGPTEDTVILPILLCIIVVLAFFGNLLVLISLIGIRRMRTGSNLMLVNLSVCDLAFTGVAIPTAILNHASPGGWVAAPTEQACKFVHYMVFVTAYVSVYTLVVSCVFRFFNEHVAARAASNLLSRGNALISCLVIWLAFALSHLNLLLQPEAPIFQQPFICLHSDAAPDQTRMRTMWVTFLTCAFLLPLLLVGALSAGILHRQRSRQCRCHRNRRRQQQQHPPDPDLQLQQQRLHISNGQHSTVFDSPPQQSPHCPHRRYADAASRVDLRTKQQMTVAVLAVTVLRTLCWLPVQAFVMVDVFGVTAPLTELYRKAEMLAVCCAFFGSCVNPVLYNCLCHDVRLAYQEVFEAVGCKCGDEKTEDDYSDMNETIMSIISDSSNHINYT